MRHFSLLLLCVGLTLGFSDPAFAGGRHSSRPLDNVESVADKCEESNCQRAVQRAVRNLRRTADSIEEYNSRLANFATSLVRTIGEATDRKTRKRVAAALARVARSSTDPEQRKNILSVARKIRKGEDDFSDLDDPFASSPS